MRLMHEPMSQDPKVELGSNAGEEAETNGGDKEQVDMGAARWGVGAEPGYICL